MSRYIAGSWMNSQCDSTCSPAPNAKCRPGVSPKLGSATQAVVGDRKLNALRSAKTQGSRMGTQTVDQGIRAAKSGGEDSIG